MQLGVELSLHKYLQHVENRFNTGGSKQTTVKAKHITSVKKANPFPRKNMWNCKTRTAGKQQVEGWSSFSLSSFNLIS